jgi:surface antigen
MQHFLRVFPLVGLLAIAGCSTGPTTQYAQGPTLTATPTPEMQVAALPSPAQQLSSAQAQTDVSAFIDAAVSSKLTSNDRAQAAGAQFNALQFGRPGAPRAWQGDNGTSGNVIVGPYVRVNAIDCRDFTHMVKLAGTEYTKKGTACREADGSWDAIDQG